MNYIISNIIGALHDDNTFYTITETDYNKGFIRVNDLKNDKEYIIKVEEQKTKG